MVTSSVSDILYPVLVALAVSVCLLLVHFYFIRRGESRRCRQGYEIVIAVCCAVGILGALLFQNMYDAIEAAAKGTAYTWTWGLTFFGGLVTGVVTFLVSYLVYLRKHYPGSLQTVVTIAGGAIPLGHAIGRIGCVLNGCCYGKPVNDGDPLAFLGIRFVTTSQKVYPTNLFEAIFLAILSAVLLYFIFVKHFRLGFSIYCLSYAVFRFAIEFLRDDDRGSFIPGISPSQFWALVLLAYGIFDLVYVIRHHLVFAGQSLSETAGSQE